MYRKPLMLLLMSMLGTFGFGQKAGDTTEIGTSNGVHKVRILISTKPFVETQHRVGKVSKSGLMSTLIDGKVALGTDSSLPKTEIASMRFFYDGKEVAVPKVLFSDCYEPNLGKGYFWLKFADDAKSIMAFMAGGDGAGGYQVFWIFRQDGRHSRFSNAVSDADYVDFSKWFFEQN